MRPSGAAPDVGALELGAEPFQFFTDLDSFAGAIGQAMSGRRESLVFEPGRMIVAGAGILLTKVETLKHSEARQFAIVDAAMNDLIRPALYQAWQEVRPVTPRTDQVPELWDVVGPVCETGDFLAKDRELALAEGDLLAIMSSGAYGFVMSSNYNTRGRAAEVMVSEDRFDCVRRRETIDDLLALEQLRQL